MINAECVECGYTSSIGKFINSAYTRVFTEHDADYDVVIIIACPQCKRELVLEK